MMALEAGGFGAAESGPRAARSRGATEFTPVAAQAC